MKKKVTKKKATKKKATKRKTAKPYVIVRSHTAGVHAGCLESRKGDTVTLTNSRRLWRWCGGSLSEVAVYGPAKGDNKFGCVVKRTDIISPQGFEVAYCEDVAVKAIAEIEEWRA